MYAYINNYYFCFGIHTCGYIVYYRYFKFNADSLCVLISYIFGFNRYADICADMRYKTAYIITYYRTCVLCGNFRYNLYLKAQYNL